MKEEIEERAINIANYIKETLGIEEPRSMSPGKLERIASEHIRHGATGLIVNRNVATGEIVAQH